ncbi:hypothetical protein J7E88_30025, partial [Streptomyces sp. ISL-10]|uniref:hypothetical protein n=1 Tax=Streptomyces sp. ISL-10 TaxID=2819172 RepID=UPI001BE9FCA9
TETTSKDLMEWWPDWAQDYRRRELSLTLIEENALYRRWSDVARVAYGLGVLWLLSGLTVLMVPPECPAPSMWRWAAVVVGSLATLGELVWVIVSLKRPR